MTNVRAVLFWAVCMVVVVAAIGYSQPVTINSAGGLNRTFRRIGRRGTSRPERP